MARLWLASGIFCTAWSAIFIRLAGVPAGTSAFYRLALAAVVLVPIWLARREGLPARRDLVRIALGGLFFAVDMSSYGSSVLLATPATATLITNTSPLFVGIIGLVWLRRRQPKRFWIGFAVALVGCVSIVGFGDLRAPSARLGEGLGFVSAAAFAMYLILTERSRDRAGTFAIAALSTTSSAAALGFASLASGAPFAGFGVRTWAMLAGLGFLTQVGGYLSIGKALGSLSAATVSVSLLLQAVVTAFLAVVVLHDRLSAAEIAGGAIVLVGVGIVNLPRRRTVVAVTPS